MADDVSEHQIRTSIFISYFFLIAWAIIGAVIFHHVECPDDINDHGPDLGPYYPRNLTLDVRKLRSEPYLDKMIKVDVMSIQSFTNATSSYMTIVFKRTDDINANKTSKWDVSGSLLFCITIVTTIGYGHLAPSTDLGKGLCSIYSIIGIPICLHAVGRMRDMAKYRGKQIQSKIVGLMARKSKPQQRVQFIDEEDESDVDESDAKLAWALTYSIMLSIYLAFIFGTSAIICYMENWSYVSSLYYTFITVTTIGFGDLLAGQQMRSNLVLILMYRTFLTFYMFVGISWTASLLDVLEKSFAWFINWIISCLCRRSKCGRGLAIEAKEEFSADSPKTRGLLKI